MTTPDNLVEIAARAYSDSRFGSKEWLTMSESVRESFLYSIRVALSAVAPQIEREWQPIETAPKNRKIIGGYYNRAGKWRSIMACYYAPKTLDAGESCEEDEDGYAPEGWYEESETQDELLPCAKLTHWQPLPSPPALIPQEGEGNG